jgi:hypothetical protein
MEHILIFCPDPLAREAISRHLIELGNYQLLFADTDRLVAQLALHNEIKLVILFDPSNTPTLLHLKDFLREKRKRMRIRLLPEEGGKLMGGWRRVIIDALKPVKPRQKPNPRLRQRFKWQPGG